MLFHSKDLIVSQLINESIDLMTSIRDLIE